MFVGDRGLDLQGAGKTRQSELRRLAREANEYGGAPVSGTLFKECLECSDAGVRPDDSFCQIDTRQFHDPERRKRLRELGGRDRTNHIGLSGPVLLGIAQDKHFGQWFFNQVLAVLAAVQAHRGPGCLHVVCFCRAGRHRSVAVASMLHRLLAKFTAWDVQIEHLASEQWRFQTCNSCRECSNPTGRNMADGRTARNLAEVSLRWALWHAARQSSGQRAPH